MRWLHGAFSAELAEQKERSSMQDAIHVLAELAKYCVLWFYLCREWTGNVVKVYFILYTMHLIQYSLLKLENNKLCKLNLAG